MKGPELLSQEKIFSLYHDLVRSPLQFSEKEIALYCQHARRDARLAEVLTEHLRNYWWKYDPKDLNKKLKRQPWPASMKPILAQIFKYCKSSPEVKLQFSRWMRDCLVGIENANPQLYFFPTLVKSKSTDREVSESLSSFSKAGYFAKDLLFNKGQAGCLGSIDSVMDLNIKLEDQIKLDLFRRIRPGLVTGTLQERAKELEVDMMTLSKIRRGLLGKVGTKVLAKIAERTIKE